MAGSKKMDKILDFALDIAANSYRIMEETDCLHETWGLSCLNHVKAEKTSAAIMNYLVQRVKEKYPHHTVYGREKEFSESRYCWICLPISGNVLLKSYYPHWLFSLALAVEGKPELAVMLDVPLNAIQGRSARLYYTYPGIPALVFTLDHWSGKKVYVRRRFTSLLRFNPDLFRGSSVMKMNQEEKETLDLSYAVAEDFPYDLRYPEHVLLEKVSEEETCSWALNAGRSLHQGFIYLGTDSRRIAAAAAFITTAGGKVTDLKNCEQRFDRPVYGALITNGTDHERITELISENMISKEQLQREKEIPLTKDFFDQKCTNILFLGSRRIKKVRLARTLASSVGENIEQGDFRTETAGGVISGHYCQYERDGKYRLLTGREDEDVREIIKLGRYTVNGAVLVKDALFGNDAEASGQLALLKQKEIPLDALIILNCHLVTDQTVQTVTDEMQKSLKENGFQKDSIPVLMISSPDVPAKGNTEFNRLQQIFSRRAPI